MGCALSGFLLLLGVVFVVALITNPKPTLIVTGVLGALLLLGVANIVEENNRAQERAKAEYARKEAERQREERRRADEQRLLELKTDSVYVDVEYSSKRCSRATPLVVDVYNGADDILDSVTFRLHAYQPGRSTDLAGDTLTFDVILKPKESGGLCYPVPDRVRYQGIVPSTLTWSAERTYPRFRKVTPF